MVERFTLSKKLEESIRKTGYCFHRQKIAVFCDSEFWHGYDWDNKKKEFKSHQDFWIPKIERNIVRDKQVSEKLTGMGWTVLRFWGDDIKNNLQACADVIERAVKNKNG